MKFTPSFLRRKKKKRSKKKRRSRKKKYTPFPGFDQVDDTNRKFIVFGDTQSTSFIEFWRERNHHRRPLILEEIARRDPAFIVHLGDLTTWGSSRMSWKTFDYIHKPILEREIPYFPILGNHDYLFFTKRALRLYFRRFPHLEKQRWYSFTFHQLGFIMLDGNFFKLNKQDVAEQTHWYGEVLREMEERDDIEYIIVCCHQPPFTNSKLLPPSKKVHHHFGHPFAGGKKTTFFMSGHCHAYERFHEAGKYFLVSGGGGGFLQKLHTDPKKIKFRDHFDGESLRFLHFCEIELREDGFLMEVVRLCDDDTFEVVDAIDVTSPPPPGEFEVNG